MAGFFGNFQGTYDPSKVIITIDGVNVHGFGERDFFTAKYDEDRYRKIKGIDGEVGRIQTLSKAGSIEFTLMDSSEANYELNRFNPDYGYIGTAPISISDLSGKSVISVSKAWLKTCPDLTKGKDLGETKWVFDCADMDIVYGGQNNNSLFDMAMELFN